VAFVGYAYISVNSRLAKTYTVVVPQVVIPTDAATIARGKYLVTKVSMCVECHAEDLGGKAFSDDAAFGHLWASNLTRGRGGIGVSYADQDFVRALTHGVKRDGRSVVFMPSQDYRFTEPDLAAVIAYVRSVPNVDRETPAPRIGPVARVLATTGKFPLVPAELIDHASPRFVAATDTTNPVAAGDYLVSSAGCRGCHGQDLIGGGGPPPGAANITPVGIGDWTESDFKRALREGKRPNGTTLAPEMPRAFGAMSDEDLSKVFAYLKTVPARGAKTKNQLKTS
jgi:mono/diheme cytochrome c family protein